VLGPELDFEDRGVREGLPGEWRLFAFAERDDAA
jgi:hypothetical protein